MSTKKFLLTLVLTLVCLSGSAQKLLTDNWDSSYSTEWSDDKEWCIIAKDSLVVSMTTYKADDGYNTNYVLEVMVQNYGSQPIFFNPDNVSAQYSKKGNDDYQILPVYNNDEYQAKVKKKQDWNMALTTLASMNQVQGYKETTKITKVDPRGHRSTTKIETTTNASPQSWLEWEQNLQSMNSQLTQAREALSENYLKKNTVYPGSSIAGYMNIQHKKGVYMDVVIYIGDSRFESNWDISNKKRY